MVPHLLRRVPRSIARTQSEVLLDILKAARTYGAYMTLDELSRLTKYNSASISAQLRNLRKWQFGAHIIQKRVRETHDHLVIWEYALGQPKGGD